MNIKDDISKALNEASKATERSLRSSLDEYYEQIEDAISSGVTHQTIIKIFNEKGFKMGISSFRGALNALRKKYNYSKTSLAKDSMKEIKNTEDEIDLDDLAKIGRQRMKRQP